jgi:ribosome-associated heat shock protein Hsp15
LGSNATLLLLFPDLLRAFHWAFDGAPICGEVCLVELEVRIDKWLWAVRLYKTRSLATEACRGGHVTIAGQHVKPSRTVRPGEVIAARTGEILRTVKVIEVIERRVGPKLVPNYMEDQTPAEEFLRAIEKKEVAGIPQRDKGAGRPTKKERRQMEALL